MWRDPTDDLPEHKVSSFLKFALGSKNTSFDVEMAQKCFWILPGVERPERALRLDGRPRGTTRGDFARERSA